MAARITTSGHGHGHDPGDTQPGGSTPKHGTVLRIGNYRLGKTLGVGSFGKVKMAEHEVTGHKVAIKILNRKKMKSLRMDEKVRREIQVLKLFWHPHIIKLYEVIETPTDIFMIMEYVSGGELFEFIVSNGRLSENEARRFFQQIISGVEYCHKHMVVHRDLKPENLLLDATRTNVKIADFGLSNMMQDGDFLKTSCGSPNYAAPEVISGKLYAGPEVDVWSCGVILYALLCARLPFDDENIHSLFQKIREGDYSIPSYVPYGARDLISAMLRVDPVQRITIAEIRKHPWFLVDLPDYLAYSPQEVSVRSIKTIDEEVLQELLSKFMISREEAVARLTTKSASEDVDPLVVAYHLIYDHKYVYGDLAQQAGAGAASGMAMPVSPPLSSSPPFLLREDVPFNVDDEASLRSAGTILEGASPATGTAPSQFAGDDTGPASSEVLLLRGSSHLWCPGVLSNKPPLTIMAALFKELAGHGYVWKCVPQYYKVYCRPASGRPKLKFCVQLYQLRPQRFLLDFKRLEGSLFSFFDECSRLLAALAAVL